MKICNLCGKTKPLKEYGKSKHNKDKLRHYCRPCASAKMRNYRSSGTTNTGLYSEMTRQKIMIQINDLQTELVRRSRG